MSDNYYENNEQLINEAGNTVFENIYQNCQNEIKDQIISKLLSKIQSQNEKINLLEKENKKLKDNFIYVLKRILSYKDEYNNNSNSIKQNNNIIANYNTMKNNNNSNKTRNKATYIINQNNTSENYKNNYCLIEPLNKSKKKFNLNNSVDNFSAFDNIEDDAKKSNINEEKAKKYLNDLYRNNFGSTDGTPYSNFINKNISLYEELFPNNTNKSNIFTDTGSSYESPYKRGSNSNFSKRNKSTEIRKKIIINDDFENDISQNDNKNKSYKKKNKKYENGSITERKNNSIDKKDKNPYYIRNQNKNIHNYKFKNNRKNIIKNESNKKNNISFVKRSPYLLNKFYYLFNY